MNFLSGIKSFKDSPLVRTVLLGSFALLPIAQAEAQTFSTIYSFAAPATGTNNFGANPQSSLLLLSNTLYGTTYFGGSIINTNGYTNFEENNGYGTVYAINTDGTGFTNIVDFTYSSNTLVTNTYYSNGFYITNVTNENLTYSFNGAYPYAALYLVTNGSNTLIYGTTSLGKEGAAGGNYASGGKNEDGDGTIFVVNLSFTNNTNSGGTNTNSGGTNTNSGGTNTNSNTNTTNFSNFTNVYSFSAGAIGDSNADGGYPIGSLLIATDTVDSNNITNALYGTAYYGGKKGYGAIYITSLDGRKVPYSLSTNTKIIGYNTNVVNNVTNVTPIYQTNTNTNTATFADIYTFTYTDGALPEAGLLAFSNSLLGVASVGGVGGNGVIYSIGNNALGYTNLYSFSATDASGHNVDGALPRGGLILSGITNTVYGTASEGGAYGYGTIYAINTDGSGFTNLYSFSNGTDGAYPYAALYLSNNTLFGTASQGGSNGTGTVFAINTDGTGFATVYTFSPVSGTNGTNTDGAYPVAGLASTNNILYGTAPLGGTNGAGTVYSIIIPSVYTLAVSASPAEGGVVSGGGSFPPGSTNIVTAMTNTNYSFVSWTQNGNVVSTNAIYPVSLNGNVSLVANFSNNLAFDLVNRNQGAPKQFQIITPPIIAPKSFGDAPFTLNTTTSVGLPVTYSRVSGPVSVSNNTVTIKGTGTVNLLASQPGQPGYYQAKSVLVSFKVNKAAQNIIFPVHRLDQNISVSSLPIQLPLTASSGLKVRIVVIKGPARISGDSIILTGKPGTVVIKATQGGNSNYLPAPSVTESFTVTP